MREYYEMNYKSGFDYAYTYFAMGKAIPAAGRVIRSETDHGLIVFAAIASPSRVTSGP